MTVPPDEDERVSQQVVYTHTASSRQNAGAIIAIIVVALLLVGFIVFQMRKSPPKRRDGALARPAAVMIAESGHRPVGVNAAVLSRA